MLRVGHARVEGCCRCSNVGDQGGLVRADSVAATRLTLTPWSFHLMCMGRAPGYAPTVSILGWSTTQSSERR